MLTTAKWAIPYPEEADPDDIPSHLQQIAALLDTTITGWKSDTWANRPAGAAIKDGLFFWAVDTGAFYVGQGGVLRSVSVTYGGTGLVSTAAFGDAPAAGTPASGAAPIDHRHGMPANPVTAHVAAADPHPAYALDTDLTAAAVNSSARYTRTFMLMGA